MIEVIFTLDYEVYGNGEGSIKDLVTDPASRLLAVFQKSNVRFVLFPDAVEFRKLQDYRADESLAGVLVQIRQLHEAGFEIGLHTHPWWHNGRYERGCWILDWTERNLCSLPSSRIDEIVVSALEFLRQSTGDPSFTPLSFRGGLWLMQPSAGITAVLSGYGIRIDSSVYKGGRVRDTGLDYRPALCNGAYWRFSGDVNTPVEDGMLLEVPIFTEMVPFWMMMKGRRLRIHRKAPVKGERSSPARSRLDFMRLSYPQKLDFCRMDFKDMRSVLDREIARDALNPEVYSPIVTIGHTKDLVDTRGVEDILHYLIENGIPVVGFKQVLERLGR